MLQSSQRDILRSIIKKSKNLRIIIAKSIWSTRQYRQTTNGQEFRHLLQMTRWRKPSEVKAVPQQTDRNPDTCCSTTTNGQEYRHVLQYHNKRTNIQTPYCSTTTNGQEFRHLLQYHNKRTRIQTRVAVSQQTDKISDTCFSSTTNGQVFR